MSRAFSKMATVACSTKRPPPIVSGKRGAATTKLTGLYCTPLDPIDAELRTMPELESAYEALQTFLKGNPDIKPGDWLVVGSTEYAIRAVEDWTWRNDVYRRLILEEQK